MVLRTDLPVYGNRHCEAVQEIGVREFLVVGPRVPPFPHEYIQWNGNEQKAVAVGLEDHLETCETLIQNWHGKADGRLNIGINLPVYHEENVHADPSLMDHYKQQVEAFTNLQRKSSLILVQDGHSCGTVKFAHEELGLTGKASFFSHSTNLTEEEIQILANTDTRVIHNPSSLASILGRCPVPELLEAGVTVVLGSDGPAPDRNCDMFRHMFQCMHYHRTYYHDPGYLPPGKVLEMVTIDAARALGLEKDLGSIEPGKKADIILVDVLKPHLQPFNMPLHRLVYYANGSDVDTVLVDGKILMTNRVISTINEIEVFTRVQKITADMLKKTGLDYTLAISDRCWGNSKF
jgi:5-methylthioadenosine/S-adenosylhomocysteine deaminase